MVGELVISELLFPIFFTALIWHITLKFSVNESVFAKNSFIELLLVYFQENLLS